jgi:carboxymethylenebutenolidase
MNKQTAIVVFLLIFLLGTGFYFFFKTDTTKEKISNNAELMEKGGVVEIVGEDVSYFQNAQGYFVRPEAPGEYPGVVMIHENRGLRPEIRDAAKTLAKEGFMVLAVDLLGGVAEDQDGARTLTAGFKQEVGVMNMRAATAYLRARGALKIASLGWCFGGRQSIELAISGEQLDATVVYYGGGMATTTERLAPIKWPVLGIFGDQDRAIPLEMVRAFELSLKTLGVVNEIYIYPGVGHAFANPSGINYAPEETIDAWNKTVSFLKKYLQVKTE